MCHIYKIKLYVTAIKSYLDLFLLLWKFVPEILLREKADYRVACLIGAIYNIGYF